MVTRGLRACDSARPECGEGTALQGEGEQLAGAVGAWGMQRGCVGSGMAWMQMWWWGVPADCGALTGCLNVQLAAQASGWWGCHHIISGRPGPSALFFLSPCKCGPRLGRHVICMACHLVLLPIKNLCLLRELSRFSVGADILLAQLKHGFTTMAPKICKTRVSSARQLPDPQNAS